MRRTAAEAQEHAQAGAEHKQAATAVRAQYGQATVQALRRASLQRKHAEAAERRQERVRRAAAAVRAEHGERAAGRIVRVQNLQQAKPAEPAEPKPER